MRHWSGSSTLHCLVMKGTRVIGSFSVVLTEAAPEQLYVSVFVSALPISQAPVLVALLKKSFCKPFRPPADKKKEKKLLMLSVTTMRK